MGDEEEGSHEGYEGDEEEGSHEGHEGDEEEACEQGCAWPDGQGHGSPWKQGEDCWRLDCEGSHQEQVRQDCQQEEQCPCEEVPMDPGRREGTQGIEDHWLRTGTALLADDLAVLVLGEVLRSQAANSLLLASTEKQG